MKSLKSRIRKILFHSKNPLFAFIVIRYFAGKNIYVEKLKISKQLYLFLKENYGFQSFSISSTGVLILYYEKQILKLPLGKTSTVSLLKNYENYIKLNDFGMDTLVNYKLIKKDDYYVMDKLFTVNLNDKDVYLVILQLSRNNNLIKIKELKENLFQNISNLEKIIGMKIFIPYELEVESCLMHGDFTKDNIMKNEKGDIVLIDLDRLTFRGILGIDLLHYQVDKNSKLYDLSFFDYLLKNNEKSILQYLYFVYRICNEYKSGILLDEEYYNGVKKCLYELRPKELI